VRNRAIFSPQDPFGKQVIANIPDIHVIWSMRDPCHTPSLFLNDTSGLVPDFLDTVLEIPPQGCSFEFTIFTSSGK
jgi:hypothetical protein